MGVMLRLLFTLATALLAVAAASDDAAASEAPEIVSQLAGALVAAHPGACSASGDADACEIVTLVTTLDADWAAAGEDPDKVMALGEAAAARTARSGPGPTARAVEGDATELNALLARLPEPDVAAEIAMNSTAVDSSSARGWGGWKKKKFKKILKKIFCVLKCVRAGDTWTVCKIQCTPPAFDFEEFFDDQVVVTQCLGDWANGLDCMVFEEEGTPQWLQAADCDTANGAPAADFLCSGYATGKVSETAVLVVKGDPDPKLTSVLTVTDNCGADATFRLVSGFFTPVWSLVLTVQATVTFLGTTPDFVFAFDTKWGTVPSPAVGDGPFFVDFKVLYEQAQIAQNIHAPSVYTAITFEVVILTTPVSNECLTVSPGPNYADLRLAVDNLIFERSLPCCTP